MRVHNVEAAYGFNPFMHQMRDHYVVHLNGNDVSRFCIMADDQGGCVEVLTLDGSDVVTEIRFGHVRIDHVQPRIVRVR